MKKNSWKLLKIGQKIELTILNWRKLIKKSRKTVEKWMKNNLDCKKSSEKSQKIGVKNWPKWVKDEKN